MAYFTNNIQNMVNEFYQYIGKIAIEYKEKSPVMVPIKTNNNGYYI